MKSVPERPIDDVPPGWVEVRRVVLTEDRLLLRLNLLALIPLAVTAVVLLGWMVLRSASAPTDAGPDVPFWLTLIIIVLVLPLHELIHGAAILGCGHRPRFGMILSKGVLYATADDALFTRRQYIVVALAPLAVISALGLLLIGVLSTGWWWPIALAVIVNNGSAIGDLWAAYTVRPYPAASLVRDTADGFIVYSPSVQTGKST